MGILGRAKSILKWIVICLGVFVLLIIVAAFVYGVYSGVSSQTTPGNTAKDQLYGLGQSITKLDKQVTVISKKQLDKYSEGMMSFIPDANYQLLSFQVEFKNIGSNNIWVSDSDFKMADAGGTQYTSLSKSSYMMGSWTDEVLPNMKITRNVLFVVPSNSAGLKILYDFGPSLTGEEIGSWTIG